MLYEEETPKSHETEEESKESSSSSSEEEGEDEASESETEKEAGNVGVPAKPCVSHANVRCPAEPESSGRRGAELSLCQGEGGGAGGELS